MDRIDNKEISNKIAEKLLNNTANLDHRRTPTDFEFSDKQLMFEQYKLLIDSAHKIEERRGGSNNFFVSVNTIFISFLLTKPLNLKSLDLKYLLLVELLVVVGIVIAWDWIKVINSYKKLNYINYALIQALEKSLPAFIFSLRGEIEAEQNAQMASNRANIILLKEDILPKMFLVIYILYFLTILILPFLGNAGL